MVVQQRPIRSLERSISDMLFVREKTRVFNGHRHEGRWVHSRTEQVVVEHLLTRSRDQFSGRRVHGNISEQNITGLVDPMTQITQHLGPYRLLEINVLS